METPISYSNPHNLKLPLNFKEEDIIYFEPHFNYELEKPEILQLNNVFYFRNGVITTINGSKIKQHLPWLEWGGHLSETFWRKKMAKAFLKFDLQIFVTKKINYTIVVNPFSDNYFHWMTEVLPKLVYLKERLNDFKILLPADCNKEYQLSSLILLKVNFVHLKKNISFFNKVFICTPLAKFSGYVPRESLMKVQNLFKPLGTQSGYTKKRIYISRKKSVRRKVSNEEELIPLLESYGFEIVYPEDLSFMESIELFRNTDILVSIHGAALTNMIFLPKGSTVFELRLGKILHDKCYYILSNLTCMSYYYQNCKSLNNSNDHINADIIVDLREFETNLNSIVGKNEIKDLHRK